MLHVPAGWSWNIFAEDQPNLTSIAQLQLFCLSPMFSQSFFIEERKVKLSTFVCFLPNVYFQMRPRIGSLQVCIANGHYPSAQTNCKALVGGWCNAPMHQWWMRLRPSVSVSLLCSECGAAACGGRNTACMEPRLAAEHWWARCRAPLPPAGSQLGTSWYQDNPSTNPPSRVNFSRAGLPLCPGGGRE